MAAQPKIWSYQGALAVLREKAALVPVEPAACRRAKEKPAEIGEEREIIGGIKIFIPTEDKAGKIWDFFVDLSDARKEVVEEKDNYIIVAVKDNKYKK